MNNYKYEGENNSIFILAFTLRQAQDDASVCHSEPVEEWLTYLYNYKQ